MKNSWKKQNAFKETVCKAYKNLFEAIKSKKKPILTKHNPIQIWYREKMDCYERSNWLNLPQNLKIDNKKKTVSVI